MARPRALTPAQHREIARRHALWLIAKADAKKHAPATIANELGVGRTCVLKYINRRLP